MKLIAALLLLVPALLSAQIIQAPPETTTIHSQTRLVVVDVVVTGVDHAPVHGLKGSDFSISDNGDTQVIRSFEEHTRASARPGAAPVLPPGFFTNFRSEALDPTFNVLLLDTINTSFSDQLYLRQQVQTFLAALSPGSNVAVFSMGTQLRMLQGFTTDVAMLQRALDVHSDATSPLRQNALDSVDRISQSDVLIAKSPAADPTQPAGTGSAQTPFIAGLDAVAREESRFDMRVRGTSTINQLETLANYLSPLPGRKNLVWATGGFPLGVGPSAGGGYNSFRGMLDFETPFRDCIKLLAQSQISVYAIEAGGLKAPPSGDFRNEVLSNGREGVASDNNAFLSESRVHSMMNMISDETGGRAIYRTNAVGEGVGSALTEGSNYYTIAFVPSRDKKEKDFHKLAVKLALGGYKLAYRRGYYPTAANNSTSEKGVPGSQFAGARQAEEAFHLATGHGVPAASRILYKVRVLPGDLPPEPRVAASNSVNVPGLLAVKPPFKRYVVDYAALPGDLDFSLDPEGNYHAHLQFITIVYLPDGRAVNRVTNVIRTTLDSVAYGALNQTGFTFHQDVSVPDKGEYSLRTSVMDLTTGRIGSIEVPLQAVKSLPPVALVPLPTTPALLQRNSSRP